MTKPRILAPAVMVFWSGLILELAFVLIANFILMALFQLQKKKSSMDLKIQGGSLDSGSLRSSQERSWT